MTKSLEFINFLDSRDAQQRLDVISESNNNIFEDMTWKFEHYRGGVIIVDFNDVSNAVDQYPKWPLARTVDWILLTKHLWLSLALTTYPSSYVHRASGLKLLWAAMAYHNLENINRKNLKEVLIFLLMHGWRNGSVNNNLNIKSYRHFNIQIQIKEWRILLSKLGLGWIARDVTDSYIQKTLKTILPELTEDELTYQDWFRGGSYNLLTLDHGRYYVEHCMSLFEKNYPLALALASTFESLPALSASCRYEQRTVSQTLPLILTGHTVEDLKRRWPSWSVNTLQRVYKTVTQYFESAYRKARLEASLLQDNVLNSFVKACDLETSSENIDRMRVIVWDWLRRKNKKVTNELLNEFHKVPWTVFENQLYSIKKHYYDQPCLIPTREDYQEIGMIEGNIYDARSSYPRQLIHLVAKAGLTSMVALTGWRRSEYGFPLSAIKRTRNNDKLDQHAFPWRYQVDWHVHKTFGKVRQLREISFSTFLIAERMQSLVIANNEQPCLYAVIEKNMNPTESGQAVNRGIRTLWGHFVKHYPGFKQLDDWNSWNALQNSLNSGSSLGREDKQELERLFTKRSAYQWSNFSVDTNLKEAWRRARDEWPRLEFFLSSTSTKHKKDWLSAYRDGTLRSDWLALLDTYLPDSTKDWINSLSQEELNSGNTTKTVMNDLVEGTLYPSPHAFRHMWAEAVYRRFDGDAGWMIRSQFKHISRAMWLAYIRDKNNHSMHERAKAQVISSLVHNHLRHQGEGYSGHLHIWLRRLFKQTSVMSPAEQEKLADRLATIEIENIKPNPWGYCLLKRRTRNKAKCADMGEPMRHNASPDLCLGCIHNLMQTENIEWTLFHAASHVEALKNPVVPAIFKASSYELVKNVTRHVRTLNPQHEALPELEDVLDHYKASRAA